MNGISGLREVGSSTSRSSSNRLLHEQRDRVGTGSNTSSNLTFPLLPLYQSCRAEKTLVTPFSYFHAPDLIEQDKEYETAGD